MPLALGPGAQAQCALHVSTELSLGLCRPGFGCVASTGSLSLPPMWAPEVAAAAVLLKYKHPCSFTSVKAPGKRLLESTELRCRAYSSGFWEGRANNGALEPGKSCWIRWACWSWVRAGKASARLWCLYWSYLKAFLKGTISGDSAGSLLLVAEGHGQEAALGWLCFLSELSLLIRTSLNLFPCWEVRRSLFSSGWSFQQPRDGFERSCIQMQPQEIIHSCRNGPFKKALSSLQWCLFPLISSSQGGWRLRSVQDKTDRRSGIWHMFRDFTSPSCSLTNFLVRGSVGAVVRLELGSLCPQCHWGGTAPLSLPAL